MSININSFIPDSKIFDNLKFTTDSKSVTDNNNSGQGSFLILAF